MNKKKKKWLASFIKNVLLAVGHTNTTNFFDQSNCYRWLQIVLKHIRLKFVSIVLYDKFIGNFSDT